MKDNVFKKSQNMNDAENKTTSRKELGTYFQNVCSEPVKRGSKQERREAEKTLQKAAGNSLLLSAALLTQPCHGANVCPGSAGAPGLGLARWAGTRRASESTREL